MVAAPRGGGEGEGKEPRRGHTLLAYRESDLCPVYGRANPSICASFLPWMATTSFQGRSRRDPPSSPLSPCAARIFRALQIPPRASTGRILFTGDRTGSVSMSKGTKWSFNFRGPDFGGGFSAIHTLASIEKFRRGFLSFSLFPFFSFLLVRLLDGHRRLERILKREYFATRLRYTKLRRKV